MRINKYIALTEGISRRTADDLIKSRSVKINDVIAQIGQDVSDKDKVEIYKQEGFKKVNTLSSIEEVTLLMYKPTRFLTSKVPEDRKKTLYSLLPSKFALLKSAGRLDFLSEGLLVLTTNGELINKLTHPKFGTKKVYLVSVAEPLLDKQMIRLQNGIILGGYKTNPVQVVPLNDSELDKWDYLRIDKGRHWYYVTLTEGRNNEIRRLFGILNHPVKRIVRIRHGEYILTKELFENMYKVLS